MTWTVQSPDSWKLTLPISRVQADRLTADDAGFDDGETPPVFVVSEADEKNPDDWRLDVYFEGRPDEALLARIRAFAGSEGGLVERLADADWVTISQAFLAPIRAGRFYIHTAAHADAIPADAIPFRIEASRAFGTGHHETTSGCLEMLSDLATAGSEFTRIADIGTGTGLLAFAARALGPTAAIVATDIDHPSLRAARCDLVTANILAGPLIALAPDFAALVAAGGTIVLAGLLTSQEADVRIAFEQAGFTLARRKIDGDWSILAMTRA
jgi:ribosomal protein L11 methyltransferase